jgi:hypothetical protein
MREILQSVKLIEMLHNVRDIYEIGRAFASSHVPYRYPLACWKPRILSPGVLITGDQTLTNSLSTPRQHWPQPFHQIGYE